MLEKLFGKYICVDCKKRFTNFFPDSLIKRCPYCKDVNWYLYKNYKSMKKNGIDFR